MLVKVMAEPNSYTFARASDLSQHELGACGYDNWVILFGRIQG